jgi:hypothetical protein
MADGRSGWDLVTSRPLSDERRRRADEQAADEARERGGKGKGKGKPKGKGKGAITPA